MPLNCDNCGVEITEKRKNKRNKHFYCSYKCNSEANRRVKERPSPEDIFLMLNTGESFSSIGRKYGVSDNAIRKWLRVAGVKPPSLQKESVLVKCTQCKKKVKKEYNQLFKDGKKKKKLFCSRDCSDDWQREHGVLAGLTRAKFIDLKINHSVREIAKMYGCSHSTLLKKFN